MVEPCDSGCPTTQINSPTIPTGNDDACNTSGNGFFCAGSYWEYDPTAPGADTATLGTCPRLFIRLGETCGMNEWLEIQTANLIVKTASPINGTDCCPSGKIWKVPSGIGGRLIDEYFISFNDSGNCQWCKIGPFSHSLVNNGPPAGSAVAILPGTPTPFPLTQIIKDLLGEWTLLGNGSARFVPKNSGRYLVIGGMQWSIDKNFGSSEHSHVIDIIVNGFVQPDGRTLAVNQTPCDYTASVATGILLYGTGSLVFNFNAGDIIEFQVQYVGHGAAPSQDIALGNDNFINIVQLSC